jgi:hypothetical protein
MQSLTTCSNPPGTGGRSPFRRGLLAAALALPLLAGSAAAQFVQVEAGEYGYLALGSDGSVVSWGTSISGGITHITYHEEYPAPPGLSYVEIAKGEFFSVLRRSDGTVEVVSDNGLPPLPIENVPALPPGLTYVEIAVGRGIINGHSLAR